MAQIRPGPARWRRSGRTIDYASSHSLVKAGLFFIHDPRAYEFRLAANAYVEP